MMDVIIHVHIRIIRGVRVDNIRAIRRKVRVMCKDRRGKGYRGLRAIFVVIEDVHVETTSVVVSVQEQ
jgi:hypothetical protein